MIGTVPGIGGGPMDALTVGPGGVLYGTTFFGGSGTNCSLPNGPGCGTVFQLSPPAAAGESWTESILYSFTGTNRDGAFPSGSVVFGKNGVLYGTSQYGGNGGSFAFYGASGCGTIFELTPPRLPGGTWTETVHNFTGQNGDGAISIAGLTLSPTGALYGTTSRGGTSGRGSVFEIKP